MSSERKSPLIKSIKNLNTSKSPEPEQIYAQVNMAAKRNSVVKEAKNDAEKLLKELEAEIISSNNNNGQEDTQKIESDSIHDQNDTLDDDNIAKSGSKNSSISLEVTKITITPQLENDNETNENLETTQSMEKSGKTVALQFDEVLSDVDVEYL